MKEEFICFLKNARKGRFAIFDSDEREQYLLWLDSLIKSPPIFNKGEVKIIALYINRSIGFYLHLAGLSGRIGNYRVRYEGCMENLIFMLEFILHRYDHYLSRKYLEKLYSKALNIVRFCPFSQKNIIEYEIDTGLIEKIHFYLEYYYSK